MRKALIVLLACAALSATGCCHVYVSPVQPFATRLPLRRGNMAGGLIYSGYKAPLTTNLDETPANSPKVGKASTAYIAIPLIAIIIDIAFDDASVEKAIKNGGIKKLHYADHEFTSVLGVYGRYTTIAYGE